MMLKRIIIILSTVLGVITLVFVGLHLAVLYDAEGYVVEYMLVDTGLVVPDAYSIERSSGASLGEDSIYFHFKFDELGYLELINNLHKTPYFNDTLVMQEIIDIKWDPDDPRKLWKLRGIWIDYDTSYFYMPLHPSNSEIGMAWIDKDKKLLKVMLNPL